MADASKKRKSSKRSGRTRKTKKHLSRKQLIGILLGGGVLVAAIIVGIVLLGVKSTETSVDTEAIPGTGVPLEDIIEEIPDELSDDGVMGKDVLEHIVGAGRAVENAYNLRPESVELTDENRDNFVSIDECLIDASTARINISISSDGIPKSDDKYYYLFEMNVYDDVLDENAVFIEKVVKDDEETLSCTLSGGSGISRLYKKFAIAVMVDGSLVKVSSPSYVTNPESVSKYPNVYVTPSTKKGILIDYTKYQSGQLQDLGVGQVAINFRVEDFLGPTTNPIYPTVHYTYNGTTYSFNGGALSGFDETIRYLTENGITVTAILLNTYSSSYLSLVHPDARSAGVCPYYMFNAATADGVEYLAAIGSFFADRYSGTTHGKVSNWVISNEVNARKEWNYMAYTDVETYTKEYAKAFRVLYNAIKSTSGSAHVLISLDQQWDRDITNNPDYDGKDVLDAFNAYISSEGNIDWGLAYHPYNVPLTTCNTWSSSKYVSRSSDTDIISMQNIEVLINYLKQEQYLNNEGSCREIMVTELGYTSSGSGGENYQAAALAYAFYKINNYPEIKGLLLNRQTDDATEIAQGLATGITSLSGSKKLSYDVFKYMDTDQFEDTCAFAKSIIGISSWSEILH